MLNAIIRFSLRNRLLVIALALFLLFYGGWQATRLPIDVFPSLDRPRVVVMTEAPGMAPEEVESLITFPLETVLNGATGVEAVRSSSGVGLSVIYVEFGWGTDIFNDRQIVAERIALAASRLPEGVTPQLAPISSIMGQIMIVGLVSDSGKTTPMELRTLADWTVRQRLLTIPGVSQVIVMGGERKQFQVLVDPHSLQRFGVTLREVKQALRESNQNTAGGYLDEQGPNEFLVRALGRVRTVDDIQHIVVKVRDDQPVVLSQVASVVEAGQVKRGDSTRVCPQRVGRIHRRPGRRAHDPEATQRRHPSGDRARCGRARGDARRTAGGRASLSGPLPAKRFYRHRNGKRRRGTPRWRHPRGRDPAPVPDESADDLHHPHGDPALDRDDGRDLPLLRHVDQHDDAGRARGGDRRAGGRCDRRRGKYLPPPAREPPQPASPAAPASRLPGKHRGS